MRRRPIPQERLSTDVLLDYESTRLPGDRSAVIDGMPGDLPRAGLSSEDQCGAGRAFDGVVAAAPLPIRRAGLSAALGLEAAVPAVIPPVSPVVSPVLSPV